MPNRIIKESICRSDTIDSLSWFEEVLFYRLIVVCDDFGRFDGRPAIIKGACFPLKDDITKAQISGAIEKLSTVGLVRGYEVRGRSYLQLTTWDCHQQKRAQNSKYPDPENGYIENKITDSMKNQSDSDRYHMISGDINGNQAIADVPEKRESRNEKRESRNGDAGARARGEVRRFEEFVSAYPKDCNRYLTETAYAGLVDEGAATEEDLVECAKNYAEACKIEGTEERYIKNAENFLREFVFEKYLPGKYKKPKKQRSGRRKDLNNFERREYDFGDLESQLLGKK